MAVSYKVLGQAKPAADTATTLYTVPTGAGNYAVISSLVVNNITGDLTNIRIGVSPYASQVFTIGITLAATDVVTVYDLNGKCSFNLFGSENS